MDKLMSRRGFVGFLASLFAVVLASSMAVPAFAADGVTGELTLSKNALTAQVGEQFKITDKVDVDYSALPEGTATHIDYVSSNDDVLTVNKHNGTVTPVSAGTATVTVYLMDQAMPERNPGKPCNNMNVLDQENITITVTAATAYGFQGDGGNAVKLNNVNVTNVAGNATVGYTNTLGDYSATLEGGYYYLTFEMTNGFRDFNGAAAFAETNGEYITLNNGTESLAADGSNAAITISEATHASKTFTVKIAQSQVVSDSTTLVIGSDLHGNNEGNTVGCDLTFKF